MKREYLIFGQELKVLVLVDGSNMKEFHFKSKGRIEYNPARGNLKKKPDWWAILHCSEEITRYYRYWVYKRYHIPLSKPSWGSHISIIRGEKPYDDQMHFWKKYDGLEVEFEYSHNVRQSGDTTGWDRPDSYWFVDVKCDFLIDIRKELNLKYDYGLHMTIGRTWL
jgi:hypothetical protein